MIRRMTIGFLWLNASQLLYSEKHRDRLSNVFIVESYIWTLILRYVPQIKHPGSADLLTLNQTG